MAVCNVCVEIALLLEGKPDMDRVACPIEYLVVH